MTDPGTAAATTSLETSRRTFLFYCAAAATAAALPGSLRLGAMRAYAASSFSFTAHESSVLQVAANTVVPGATIVSARHPAGQAYEGAGDSGAVTYVETLLTGAMLYAAGARRPPYVKMPPGVSAGYFPNAGAAPLWTVKRMGWFGDPQRRATRPYAWPSELERLQNLYRAGVTSLDQAMSTATAGAVTSFDGSAGAAHREPILRSLQAQEVAAFNGQGERGQPFFLTFLDHVAQACFGDPVYGGNRGYQYWEMCNFSGPSFINAGGPAPGQGWSWKDMQGQFDRSAPPGLT